MYTLRDGKGEMKARFSSRGGLRLAEMSGAWWDASASRYRFTEDRKLELNGNDLTLFIWKTDVLIKENS